MHNNHCHRVTAQLQFIIIIINNNAVMSYTDAKRETKTWTNAEWKNLQF